MISAPPASLSRLCQAVHLASDIFLLAADGRFNSRRGWCSVPSRQLLAVRLCESA